MYKKIGYIGLSVLLAITAINILFFQDVQTLDNPIIKLEFTETQAGIDTLFLIEGSNKYNKKLINAVNNGVFYDYPYAVLYALFLIFLFMKLAKVEQKKYYYIGAILAACAFVFDCLENLQIHEILAKVTQGNYNDALLKMKIFTWIKWLSLALIFFIFSLRLNKKPMLTRLFIAVLNLPFALGFTALISGRTSLAEIFAYTIMLNFTLLIIWSLIYSEKNKALI